MESKKEETMYGDKVLGRKLKNFRVKKKLTQRKLAKALNVTQSFISKMESGASMPNTQVLRKYRELYGLNVNKILGDIIK